ncbi:AAA family ATPase [Xanthomonas sp. WHRI 10064A]|uniref:McrB family protein n=1 Tax=unclassified Xanthomonas TaxID=2643310 RepID=UPI002B2256C6|nr:MULTISPECIES: AAA family ATPase [unclassified Xanthomonas]MEA9586894.1 AAA family ATPase [Xanthomonas sp. WHRI 10064B]MEA9616085.1 AAA family ATPase [Xanthomonas sp. WHRI 10064A]
MSTMRPPGLKKAVEPEERRSRQDLGIPMQEDSTAPSSGEQPYAAPEMVVEAITEEHPLWISVIEAKMDGYGGVILSGPPGTGKSWYAQKIAARIAGSQDRIRTVQFHTGYQYEDFVQGWEPDGTGGFKRTDRHLLAIAKNAKKDVEHNHVLVIDEISRADVPRVLGEALTYLEMSLRDRPFYLASGQVAEIPRNLFIIATMNPWDVSVDELDIALERRFAHIEVPPSANELLGILDSNGADTETKFLCRQLFDILQGSSNKMIHVGHAYFSRVRDRASLDRLWDFQIWPHIRRVTRLDAQEATRIERAWQARKENPPAPRPADQPVSNNGQE